MNRSSQPDSHGGLGDSAAHRGRSGLSQDLILDAAEKLLIERGVVAFRLRELAEELGVEPPYLYRFFRDRDHIVFSAYARAVRDQTAEACARLDALDGETTTLFEIFSMLVGARSPFGEEGVAGRQLLRLQGIGVAFANSEAREEVSAALAPLQESITRLIAESQATTTARVASVLKRSHSSFAL